MGQVQGCSLGARAAKCRALHQTLHPGTTPSSSQKPLALAGSNTAALAQLPPGTRSVTAARPCGASKSQLCGAFTSHSPVVSPSRGAHCFLQHHR